MTTKDDGNKNPQSAKVLQLGFNISVSGDPGTDFEIVLDDKEQKAIQLPSQSSDGLQDLENKAPKNEIEKTHFQDEVKLASSTGAIPKQRKYLSGITSSESDKMSDIEKPESTIHKDSSLINEIKSTMEHFEKFSDHIREIPRLKSHPLATSTPFSDKQNSKSESSLIYPEYRPRRFAHLYDFHSKREYFKGSMKPLPPDLFLKPLPGEDYYKRGNFTRYLDVEPYKHYGSVDSLNKTSDYKNAVVLKSKFDIEKYDLENLTGEAPVGILKKSDSENGDKQSTSSADSIKDIKIYQSGGIIIMQNFKDSMDMIEKKEISDFSAKLIENCHKLRDEITSGFPDDKPAIGNSSDEGKNSGKMVQFDLSGFEGQKSKSGESLGNIKGDCSPVRMESSESTSDCVKIKDTSPQGTSQSQDFPSLSTQENDSVVSNQPGMSPTFASGKKLEWDSGADVGYLNLDLSKENLSTIERIVLKGISSDGLREKKVVYEKKPEQAHTNRSKFILERMSSDSITEDISENKIKTKSEENMTESSGSGKKEKPLRSKQEKFERKPHEDKPSERHATDGVSKEHSKEPSTQFTGEELKLLAEGKVTSKHEGSQEEDKLNQKIVVSSDKSVNVNTLFEDAHPPTSGQTNRTEDFKHVEYPKIRAFKLSPKVKKLKKKKVSNQKNLTGPLKDKIDSIIDIARCSSRNTGSRSFEMGIPRKIYKKLEAKPELNDFESSRDLEEIIIDQRFKIKQSLAVGRETSKGTAVASKNDENEESKKETKAKSRPISASSSSNNTVLPNAEAKELPGKKDIVQSNKFTDQIIQTNNCKVESVGIQAFDSLKSSEGDAKISKDVQEAPEVVRDGKENANVSSKNIQSFGLNSSLPKELAHPKESKSVDNRNTKSTQFFGGPINSLPNYHASLTTKPGESCGRMPKVLKAKKNLEAEIIRLKEENEKNIMANEGAKISEVKKRRENNPENKENLVTEKSVGSRRSQSNASRNMSKGSRNNEASQESEKNSKEKENSDSRNKKPSEKETNSREESECLRTSEEVSSKILTSEVLREHGDSIDRNIIQEKYFQSQLIELEKREMISRSTSMEKQLESQSRGKELVTTGCQYSPQSKETVSESKCRGTDYESKGKPNVERRRKETSERYDDSSQNLMEEERFGTSKSTNQEQDFEAGDSLPSSTQTAHSWIPGMRDFEGARSGVGRARSFEYLPGHIYESSGNLREELPSETEQNLITSSSSESNAVKRSVSEEARDSEGRNTLVLENSTEVSQESDKMKNLNEHLTQLDIVVAKLREKEIQIQTITQTLLVKLKKENNGSGDHSQALGGRQEPSILKPNGVDKKSSRNCSDGSKEGGDCRSGVSSEQSRKQTKEKDVSIACQTEEKSSASGPEKFYQERRALERRISEEKESQIKWIENEIHHLNILRGLLEKQNFSSLKKKRRSSLSVASNDESKSTEKYPKEISGEAYPPAVTPVYGCTISLVENSPDEGCDESRESPAPESRGEAKKYGMAVSLSGGTTNAQRMVMIPVGVQVTLKDVKLTKECSEAENGESRFRRPSTTPPNSICRQPRACSRHHDHRRISQSDVNTQHPSPGRTSKNFYSTYAQTSFSSSVRCGRCQQTNCVCLDLSDKSYDSTCRSSKSKISEKRKSLRLSFEENEEAVVGIGEKTRSDSTVAEVLDIESDPVSKASQRNLEKSAGSRTESLGSCLHRRTVQDADCKCGNCSKIGAKPGTLRRGPCESNIYLNCEKSSKGFGTCHCSKIQVQKSSNCACHIIKIHGSKCSSAENDQKSSCSCKRSAKKTENQSCQTEEVSVASRDPAKQAGGEEACGGKTAVESRAPVAEFPYSPEDSHERRRPCFRDEKEVPKEIPERDVPAPGCGCQKKQQKEKPKVDDHPRHYFLKIEETEVEDLNESMERRKSLEVITVTVPVKKAGKAKIYGNKFRQSCQSEELGEESFKGSFPNVCNCCKDCPGSRKAPEATKTTAEKQESPRRVNHFPKPVEWDFFGDVKNYGEVDNRRYRDPNCQSQEFYRQRNGPDYAESKAYRFDQCRKENRNSRPDHWDRSQREDSPLGEARDEYDSHKEGRRPVEGEASTFHEGREYRQSQGGKVCLDRKERFRQDSESRNNRCQANGRDFDRHNPDYYNYNKREFMTKSELLREEEKKRVRQPSLQESLASNRPDFCSSAESRRQMISERAKERVRRHNNRMECLINLIHHCDDRDQARNTGQRRMFTTSEMREQTMKKYKKLPEVTGRIADEKKKQEYRTNKLMGDIYGKKLQIQALKGHINLSNSVSVLSTI